MAEVLGPANRTWPGSRPGSLKAEPSFPRISSEGFRAPADPCRALDGPSRVETLLPPSPQLVSFRKQLTLHVWHEAHVQHVRLSLLASSGTLHILVIMDLILRKVREVEMVLPQPLQAAAQHGHPDSHDLSGTQMSLSVS